MTNQLSVHTIERTVKEKHEEESIRKTQPIPHDRSDLKWYSPAFIQAFQQCSATGNARCTYPDDSREIPLHCECVALLNESSPHFFCPALASCGNWEQQWNLIPKTLVVDPGAKGWVHFSLSVKWELLQTFTKNLVTTCLKWSAERRRTDSRLADFWLFNLNLSDRYEQWKCHCNLFLDTLRRIENGSCRRW